jgi:2-polyprenyl-6-methoxyphenol hydroxylase-like FAD-dependent oxidoreductase
MKHAVIIGASLAGCMCASALADRADEVVVVERDRSLLERGPRRGVPQGRRRAGHQGWEKLAGAALPPHVKR